MLFVVAGVWDIWMAESRHSPLRETGGILIGYWTSARDLVVTHATGPGPRARRTWSSVELDGEHAQRELDAIYWGSKGALTFVGDWHTHPFRSLRPSHQDISTLRGIVATSRYRTVTPLIIICGPTWPEAVRPLPLRWPSMRAAAYLFTDNAGLIALPIRTIPAIPEG